MLTQTIPLLPLEHPSIARLSALDLDAQRAAGSAILNLYFRFAETTLVLHRAELEHTARLTQDLVRIQRRRRQDRLARQMSRKRWEAGWEARRAEVGRGN